MPVLGRLKLVETSPRDIVAAIEGSLCLARESKTFASQLFLGSAEGCLLPRKLYSGLSGMGGEVRA